MVSLAQPSPSYSPNLGAGMTNNDSSPEAQHDPKSIFLQPPFHNQRHQCPTDPRPGPEYAKCQTFALDEPFVKIEDERVVEEGTADAVHDALCEEQVADVIRKGGGDEGKHDHYEATCCHKEAMGGIALEGEHCDWREEVEYALAMYISDSILAAVWD